MNSTSFRRAAWKRLRKNIGALFGLFVIIVSVLVAVFAYFIAPDSSPYADRIILEIGGNKPGYKQSFLQVKDSTTHSAGFFQQLVSGKEDKYEFIPIVSHETKGDSIIVQKFIDEELSERQAYSLSQLADKPVIEKNSCWVLISSGMIS